MQPVGAVGRGATTVPGPVALGAGKKSGACASHGGVNVALTGPPPCPSATWVGAELPTSVVAKNSVSRTPHVRQVADGTVNGPFGLEDDHSCQPTGRFAPT